MVKRSNRLPKNYRGTGITSRPIQSLFPAILGKLSNAFKERPDLILQAWPEVVGEKLAPMAKAVRFERGVIHVRVSNSSLYSLLAGPEKGKLLRRMRSLFPKVEIKDLLFKMG